MSRSRMTAVVTALALGACSQQATVTRTDGPPVEGVIVRSTPRTVYVAPMADSPAEARLRRDLLAVPRRAIVDVDYPGLAPEVGGWALIGGGAVSFGMAGLVHFVGHAGEYATGPDPVHVAIPVAAGGVLFAAGVALVSWAWGVEDRARRAAGRFDGSIGARGTDADRRRRHAEKDSSTSLQLGVKSVVYADGDAPSLGLTAGVALPIVPRIRIEPAAEVDVANTSPVTVVRLPLRLAVALRFADSDYRLHIVPELGYSVVIPGETHSRAVQHGITGGLMLVHTVPWGERIEFELGQGMTTTRFYDPASFAPGGAHLGFRTVDVLHLRLGVRYDL